jgi:hypothetical protein
LAKEPKIGKGLGPRLWLFMSLKDGDATRKGNGETVKIGLRGPLGEDRVPGDQGEKEKGEVRMRGERSKDPWRRKPLSE